MSNNGVIAYNFAGLDTLSGDLKSQFAKLGALADELKAQVNKLGANWQSQDFVVDGDNAQHHPTYTALVPMSSGAATYQCGCDPQAGHAFEPKDDIGHEMGDALTAPFIAGWEIVRMPVAAILDWPGSVTTQDPAYFDRYHQPASTFDLGTSEANQ